MKKKINTYAWNKAKSPLENRDTLKYPSQSQSEAQPCFLYHCTQSVVESPCHEASLLPGSARSHLVCQWTNSFPPYSFWAYKWQVFAGVYEYWSDSSSYSGSNTGSLESEWKLHLVPKDLLVNRGRCQMMGFVHSFLLFIRSILMTWQTGIKVLVVTYWVRKSKKLWLC